MKLIDVDQLCFRYTTKQPLVINKLSFGMTRGEIVGVLGPSGSGKSTLLRLIAGLETAESGTISIGDKIVSNNTVHLEPDRRGVGMVFQDYALFPHLNVAKNVGFGLHKLKRSERIERQAEMLELVQLQDYAQRYPHELSGGQQQRIALARALAPRPDLLLMDEPFSNLDENLKSTIRTELRVILERAQMTCLFVSHDKNDLDAISDRILDVGQQGN